MELPAVAADAAVANLQRGLLRAVQDKLQDALDDEVAAAAYAGNATLAVTVATRSNRNAPDTYVYTLSVGVPTALLGKDGAPLPLEGRRRALSDAGAAIPAALGDLPQSGYLLQRLHELGFDADALASSGALSVSSGLQEPPPPSSDRGPSGGSGSIAGGAAAGIGVAVAIVLLALLFYVCGPCWAHASSTKKGLQELPAARPDGTLLRLRYADIYVASGMGLGENAAAAPPPPSPLSAPAAAAGLRLGPFAPPLTGRAVSYAAAPAPLM